MTWDFKVESRFKSNFSPKLQQWKKSGNKFPVNSKKRLSELQTSPYLMCWNTLYYTRVENVLDENIVWMLSCMVGGIDVLQLDRRFYRKKIKKKLNKSYSKKMQFWINNGQKIFKFFFRFWTSRHSTQTKHQFNQPYSLKIQLQKRRKNSNDST